MTTYSLQDAASQMAEILHRADSEGEVGILGEAGRLFVLKPAPRSPLDVSGVDLDLSTDEIVSIVRESRER